MQTGRTAGPCRGAPAHRAPRKLNTQAAHVLERSEFPPPQSRRFPLAAVAIRYEVRAGEQLERVAGTGADKGKPYRTRNQYWPPARSRNDESCGANSC